MHTKLVTDIFKNAVQKFLEQQKLQGNLPGNSGDIIGLLFLDASVQPIQKNLPKVVYNIANFSKCLVFETYYVFKSMFVFDFTFVINYFLFIFFVV